MTTLSPSVLLGRQRPRVSSVPPHTSTDDGTAAVELARSAGLVLDDWQAWVVEQSLAQRAGSWAAFEVAVVVPRQNGKGVLLECRELAGLFVLGEQMILHSAHEFKTAAEAFRRVLALVTNTDDLRRQVKKVRTSHGEEGIELLSGARLRFVARSTGSGRGFTGDCVILDEAYNLTSDSMAALLPTLSARPDPQLWYASSAGMEASEQLRRVRERGTAGGDPSLAYFEWSADPDSQLDDRDAWADANPALGIRISPEFVTRERAALAEAEFARERLGIWDDARRDHVIDPGAWAQAMDSTSSALDPVAFAVDVTPDRRHSSIAMCGARRDGLLHVELVENRSGTSWVVERLNELVERWRPVGAVLDPGGAAGSLIPELESTGVVLNLVSGREMAQACGAFFDDVTGGRLRHIGQPLVAAALAAARKRPVGDAWAWHRRDATDISPLVAVTLARHGFVTVPKSSTTFVPYRIY